MNSKIGRNQLCPCGSGKKYKRCHGSITYEDMLTRGAEEARLKFEMLRLQRERQQGKGRPIIAVKNDEYYVVVVGRRLRKGKWKTFPDFLFDYIKNVLGNAWGQAEIGKPEDQRHQVILWYQAVCNLQAKHILVPGEVSAMPMLGVARAYLGLAYDLYTLEHNEESTPGPAIFDRLLHRLKHPDQFVGARYEIRVAAMFLRAGFTLQWEDETDGSTTHGEFTATFPQTGREFWIECKIRQRDPKLDSNKKRGRFISLVSNALRKETDKQRFVFVDLNTPAKPILDKDNSGWRDWAVSHLRILEGSPEAQLLPSALVMITNYPDHHHLDTAIPDVGGAIEGFKMDDYRTGEKMTLHEAIERRERHVEVEALLHSMSEHYGIPSTFDGEIPELEGITNRLIIGRQYEFDLGRIGTLIDACVMEERQAVAAVMKLEDGTHGIVQMPISEMELAAWKQYPETFFGVMRDPQHSAQNVLDLYDFFLRGFAQTSKDILLSQMAQHDDVSALANLSQGQLAKLYAEWMTEAAVRASGAFPIPTWVDRMRPPPGEKGLSEP